jgi:hypothetical protein
VLWKWHYILWLFHKRDWKRIQSRSFRRCQLAPYPYNAGKSTCPSGWCEEVSFGNIMWRLRDCSAAQSTISVCVCVWAEHSWWRDAMLLHNLAWYRFSIVAPIDIFVEFRQLIRLENLRGWWSEGVLKKLEYGISAALRWGYENPYQWSKVLRWEQREFL